VGELADGRPFYVMRLVRGTTLAEHAPGLGRGELLRLFLQVCDAVAFAHARGVVHRDLTPRNVMIGEFGEVLVVDWGVARVVREVRGDRTPDAHDDVQSGVNAAGGDAPGDGERTADGVVVGTPGFMAPEQAGGGSRDADARADVFGLGAILRHLLATGDAPVPRALAAIASHATAPDPAARYPDAPALARDVRRWLDGEPVQAYPENAFERLARVYGRNRPLILLLVTYAVVRIVILLWRGV
jgi:serine/threonine-protein kinase